MDRDRVAKQRSVAEYGHAPGGIRFTENGWNLYVGGNGGFRPRHADLLLADVDTETLVRTIDRFLMFYVRSADRLQRTAAWVESLEGGLDYLRSVIVEDSLGICADLDADSNRGAERSSRDRSWSLSGGRGESGAAVPGTADER